jgi:hypothetical protein
VVVIGILFICLKSSWKEEFPENIRLVFGAVGGPKLSSRGSYLPSERNSEIMKEF